MLYADAAAFFGMNALWDWVSETQHYAGRTDPGLFSETDSIVLVDDAPDAGAQQIFITEMGRAIGHYARWAPRGSVRLEATSDDPLVQVTGFRDDADARLSLVLINNVQAARTVNIGVENLALASTQVAGEQSVAGSYWQPITAGTASGAALTVTLPALSVTSLGAALAGTSSSSGSLGSSSGSGGTSGAASSSTGSSSASATGSSGGAGTAGTTSGTGTSGAAAAGSTTGSTGGTVDGGCGSAGGLELLAPLLVLFGFRRRGRRTR